MLAALERYAAERGWTAVRLDTNRNLTEAIAMYRRAGYREVEAFNTEHYAHHWFEKHLAPDGLSLDPSTDHRGGDIAAAIKELYQPSSDKDAGK